MSQPPRVSIGIPVYNGAETLPRTLDSLLAQTFRDCEIIVSDNASTDTTAELCEEYSKRDSRIRYHRNATNIGQIANFNRAFELCHGEYFRWAGCNDWWEPAYLQRCVQALDRHPSAVLVTCYQAHYDEHGRRYYEEYKGARVESDLARHRFARMLWFLQANRFYIDPIYSVIRRSALLETSGLRMMMGTDRVLAAELSLIGPFCHVPECLAYRTVTEEVPVSELVRRFDPKQSGAVAWFAKMCVVLGSIVMASSMSRASKTHCLWSLTKFLAKGELRQGYRRVRRLLGSVYSSLGTTANPAGGRGGLTERK